VENLRANCLLGYMIGLAVDNVNQWPHCSSVVIDASLDVFAEDFE